MMAYTTVKSTNNRFVGLFSGTTSLTAGTPIFNGYTASPSTFQFTKGFVDAGKTASISFGAAGLTMTLPEGMHAFDERGMAIGSTNCNGVTVVVSAGGFAILEFKGTPTTIDENYFK